MSRYDAIILGGGPAGSTAAAVLARAGRRVVVVEKEKFPRFHIGESLLPYNRGLFEEIGVWPKLARAGFVTKLGARFELGSGERATRLAFRNGAFNQFTEAIHVERAEFDEILLRHAADLGAEVREGCAATGFAIGAESARVRLAGGDELEASMVLDATGIVNFTGNLEGIRRPHEGLRKVAIFGHFRGVALLEGEESGDIAIVRLKRGWVWLIPIGADKVSVGLVIDAADRQADRRPADAIFAEAMDSAPALQRRMGAAQPLAPLRSLADFSYRNERFASPRLIRIGDAAGFLDPIFSSGVYLAMHSGRDGARAALRAIDAGVAYHGAMRRYETRLRRSMGIYLRMIEQFYTKSFIQVLLEPKETFRLASAVNTVLAGNIGGGFPVWWRLKVFFGIVGLQKRLPLVERVEV
ncbi:MAG: NAD(P)/FAD-dependent oxidoreductase [Verrucomicrobiales bacterium]